MDDKAPCKKYSEASLYVLFPHGLFVALGEEWHALKEEEFIAFGGHFSINHFFFWDADGSTDFCVDHAEDLLWWTGEVSNLIHEDQGIHNMQG